MKHVTYKGGSTEVYIPFDSTYAVGALCARGGSVEVPDEIAGEPPGPWRPVEPGEVGEHPHGFTVRGWPLRLVVDGAGAPVLGEDGGYQMETYDPGSGLLAQVDVWEAGKAKAAKGGEPK